MEIISKQLKIKKTTDVSEIENILKQFGEPVRWAIVAVNNDEITIEANLKI